MYKSVISDDIINYLNKDATSGPIGQDLSIVIAADVLSNNKINVLKNVAGSIKPQGFIILEETAKVDLKETSKVVSNMNLIVLAKQTAGGKSYVLLKNQEPECPNPNVVKVATSSFDWVEELKKATEEENRKRKLILLNKSREVSGIVGLSTCVRAECPDIKLQYLYVQDDVKGELQANLPVYAAQLKKQLVANVLKNGQWGSYQHLRLDHQKDVTTLPVEHAYINTITRGDLSSLTWIESPLRFFKPDKQSRTEMVHVYYATLNFKYECFFIVKTSYLS